MRGLLERLRRIVDIPAEPVYSAETHPKAGRWESPNAIPPLPPAGHECPNCAGLQRTVQLLRQERAALRGRLIRAELPATRHQRLGRSEQLP
jgi:hypothetical protein